MSLESARHSLLLGALVLASGAATGVAGFDTSEYSGTRDRRSLLSGDASNDVLIARAKAESPLKIENARLDAAPPPLTATATVLKFDVVNNSPTQVTDVVLEVSIVERPAPDERVNEGNSEQRHTAHVVVGPFIIRGRVIIEAGYTLEYEVLLRNFTPGCSCVAKIDVLSVRALSNPTSRP